MTAGAATRVRGELVRLAHRGLDVHEFCLAAGRVLARSVPFDGLCVLSLDPATLLPVDEVVEHGLPPEATARMAEIELAGTDVNAFSELFRTGALTGTLGQATHGDLDESRRHRELRRPHGFGDELRAVLVDGRTPWGALTLLRAGDRPDFTPAEAAVVARLAGPLAEGLRRATLLQSRAADRDHNDDPDRHHNGDPDDDPIGVVLLAADDTVLAVNAAARRWLAELRPSSVVGGLPPPVGAVAVRARCFAEPSGGVEAAATARVCTRAGHWLIVRGSTLGDPATTVIVIEPAGPHDLAPLIAAAYGLTERERKLTRLIARGYSTTRIAELLHLSPWTVQDHLKSVFDKVGVGSRGALVAQLFFEHYAPGLADRR
jgi:DNA-binding CsgD family transcriptional regulator